MAREGMADCIFLHKHRKSHIHTQTPNIRAVSGIRTHDPGFRASEGSACPRPVGYRDRQNCLSYVGNLIITARNTYNL
jgi:hypothetical protein